MIVKVALLFVFTGALTPTRTHQVNLDLPPKERWNEILKDKAYEHFVTDMIGYFDSVVGKRIDVISWIAEHMTGIFPIKEYVEEMEGMSETLTKRNPEVKNPLGLLVAGNLLYQLEGLAIECKLFNTTGPCPPGTTYGHPSLCSSIITVGEDGNTHLGRNMDWNFPKVLAKYIIKVDYQRKKKTIFSGTGFLGFVGVLHGMNDRYAISFNARDNGGSVFPNLWSLMRKFMTPSQLLRQTLENESYEFCDAVQKLSTTRIANPCYFIVADGKKPNGTIIVRDREEAPDVWYLEDEERKATTQPKWFKVQTNYDPNEIEPSYDARREPAMNHLLELGQENLNAESLLEGVMKKWPTLNPYTDIVALMTPANGQFKDFTTQNTEAQNMRDEHRSHAPDFLRGDSIPFPDSTSFPPIMEIGGGEYHRRARNKLSTDYLRTALEENSGGEVGFEIYA